MKGVVAGITGFALVATLSFAAKADGKAASDWIAILGKDEKAVKELPVAKPKHRTRIWCGENDPRVECGAAAAVPTEPTAPVVAPAGHDLTVSFEFDSDRLTTEAKSSLASLAEALNNSRIQSVRLGIDGYTDAKGDAAYNQSLSQRRAQAVTDQLVAQGVRRDRLVTRGFGSANPRVDDPFAAENRRVEAKVLQ